MAKLNITMKKEEVVKIIEKMGSQSLIDAVAMIDYHLTHNGGYSPEDKRLMRAIEEMEIDTLVATREAISDEMFIRDIAIINARGRKNTAAQPNLVYDPPPPHRTWDVARPDKIVSVPEVPPAITWRTAAPPSAGAASFRGKRAMKLAAKHLD